MNVVNHNVSEKNNNEARPMVLTSACFSWIMKGTFLLAVILGFLYVLLLNSLATQGFALEEIKSERILIQKEVEKWDIELAIPISLYALQSSEQVQEMEQVEGKSYVSVEQGKVAMR